jgi:hypothetical protein
MIAVLSVIEQIWYDEPRASHLVVANIETVLDLARAEGQRSTDNPARWNHTSDRSVHQGIDRLLLVEVDLTARTRGARILKGRTARQHLMPLSDQTVSLLVDGKPPPSGSFPPALAKGIWERAQCSTCWGA